MIRIDAQTAKTRTWGAVVVGTSFASMFFAHGLRGVGPILFVEKGQVLSHADLLATRRKTTPWKAYQGGPWDEVQQQNTSGATKFWPVRSIFGGSSNSWFGGSPRFHPDDFRLQSLHGVGIDWPLRYEDLESYYGEVEDLMDISGGGSDHLLPRSRPFPSPPHAPSRSDVRLRAHGRNWFAAPTARSNGSRRPKCCANGVCGLCPIDSKFTITNSLSLFDRPDFHLLLETEARLLRVEAGTARSLMVRSRDRSEYEIRGERFALGANAIFNPAILMRSGFRNPHIGRYLHDQAGQDAYVDIDAENYFGGTLIAGVGYDFYPGAHRSEAAAVMLENFNIPAKLRPEPKKWLQRLALRMIAEDLPSPDNRVTLDRDEALLQWTGYSDYAKRGFERVRGLLPGSLPFAVEKIEFSEIRHGENHILGTMRMGRDPTEGVVDDKLVSFEARNVLCLGAGAFPTSGPANPTLTLSALSLRAGRSLRDSS